MKTFISTLLTLLTLNLSGQKLQVTGMTNIDAQWNQMVKTIDSLNIVIVNNRKDFVSWQNNANARIRVKSDSISLLKAKVLLLGLKIDSLTNVIDKYNVSLTQFITGDQLASFGSPSGFYSMAGDGKQNETTTFFSRSNRDALPTDRPFEIYIGYKVGNKMKFLRMMDTGL